MVLCDILYCVNNTSDRYLYNGKIIVYICEYHINSVNNVTRGI